MMHGDTLLFKHLEWKRILPVFILILVLSASIGWSEARTESDIFPLYPCIQPNVTFWVKVYTQYPSDQGLIHDKRQMDRIYGIISLVDPYRAGGRKINKKRINAVKKKYKAILTKLMQGQAPVGPEEKRVAEMLGPDAKAADFRLAIRNLRCQTGQKDRFREGLIRSGAYIDEIKQIFRDADLPQDLAYLPHVESSFNPKAYSKFGAAGMWQFTRSTGKRFMKVGYAIDERRDPILSSHAAAKLLRHNRRKLNTWPMAVTAYNHGVTGMRRAQRKKGSYERIFKEYRSRIFRFASRNFYSEFLAAREAAKNYRQYFGDLKLDRPLKTQEIELRGFVSLPELAQHIKVDLAELRAVNPALRDPVFRGQKYAPRGYRLRLPDRTDRDWEPLIARFPSELYRQNQKRSTIYKVRKGDTAGKIAKTHGVKLNDLIAVNNLNRRATIYVNQNLRLPLHKDKSSRVSKHKSTKNNPAAPSPPAASPLPAQRVPQSADSAEPVKRYFAANQMVDFLLAQAQPLEMDTEVVVDFQTPELADGLQNDASHASLPENIARPHMQTAPKSPIDSQIKPQIMQGHFAVERISMQRGKSIGYIRVEPEETLGHYAEWLKVSARSIRRLNGLRYGQPLSLSRQIKIPLNRVTKEDFEELRFEFQQELAEDFFISYRVEKVLTYSIKRGDNIWTLSRREFEVPLWLIKRYNGDVDFGALIPSQKLLIPVIEKNV